MFMRIGSSVPSSVVVSSLVPKLWLDATDIGTQGFSLDFDGVNDEARADNEITDYPFTIECWAKTDSAVTTQVFFGIVDGYWYLLLNYLSISNVNIWLQSRLCKSSVYREMIYFRIC